MKHFVIPLVFALSTSLALSEFFLRFFWPQENMYLYVVHEDYIFNRPGFTDHTAMRPYTSLSQIRKFLNIRDQQIESGSPLYKPLIKINSQGFREDHEINKAKTKPVRLVNLGGSIGFGWPEEDLSLTYAKQLEKIQPTWETLNCSIIAANSPQLLKIYQRSCSTFEHDWVIVQVTTSPNIAVPDFMSIDFWGSEYRIHQNLWWTKRISIVENDKLANRPYQDLIPPIDWQNQQTRKLIESAYRPKLPLYEYSHLVRFFENSLILTPRRSGDSPIIGQILKLQNEPWFILKVKELLDHGEHPTLKSIVEMAKVAEQRKARILVIIIPNHFDVISGNAYNRQDIKWLMKSLELRHIPFLKPDEWFRPDEISKFYRFHDEHPTDFGYHRMAEVIARKIRDLGEKR